MRIGITGYGKMGVLVHRKALEAGHVVPAIIDPGSDAKEITARELTSTAMPLDVIIDFTEPGAALAVIERCAELKVSAVIGTTGWYGEMDRVSALVEESGIGLIWSGNFSLGVNMFFHLVKTAGRIMNRFSQYDAMVHEHHHNQKIDSPSGTARMIGEILVSTLEAKKEICTGRLDRRIEPNELHVSSTRGGAIPGIHRVLFDSESDTITIEHSLRNRESLADGALLAAEWIKGRKGLYNIDDMMQSIIGG